MKLLIGIGMLLVVLAVFALFSLKAPKGGKAMGGLADAAVASYLVEAVHYHVSGAQLGITFLGQVGEASGGLSGVASGILVPISMGANPVFAVVGGLALGPIAARGGFGILPGFVAGYAIYYLDYIVNKFLPEGLDAVVGALAIAPLARLVATIFDPVLGKVMETVGLAITAATDYQPLVMGFLLGGIMKVVCTAPISSMALTAMLGLTGLPMGIAGIACFGGSFTNGIILKMLNLGNSGQVVGIMLEPLTQAETVMANPIPIFGSNVLGGGLAGLGAAALGIINDAPGTAAPIPGALAAFGFNPAGKVLLALLFAAIGGSIGGVVGGLVFKKKFGKSADSIKQSSKKEVIATA